jgi:hypothetical protein
VWLPLRQPLLLLLLACLGCWGWWQGFAAVLPVQLSTAVGQYHGCEVLFCTGGCTVVAVTTWQTAVGRAPLEVRVALQSLLH